MVLQRTILIGHVPPIVPFDSGEPIAITDVNVRTSEDLRFKLWLPGDTQRRALVKVFASTTPP